MNCPTMNCPTRRTLLMLAAALLSVGSTATPGWAQMRIVSVEAVTGGRFGVGQISVDASRDMLPEVLGVEGLGLSEKDGRVLYPAIRKPVFGELVREFVNQDTPLTTGGPVREEVGALLRSILNRPPRTSVYFLFRGEAPLELTLEDRSQRTLTVTPRNNPNANRRLLEAWWREYAAGPRLLEKRPDYPPLVSNYLKSSLARRLVLNLPKRQQTDSWQDQLKEELGLTLGTESVRLAMQQDRILGLDNLDQVADQPLPAPIGAPPLEFPPIPADVKIEPIALRVPVECFYLRFGSWGNYLWMQDTREKWGGDLQNLVAARGLDYGMNRRMENQLVLKQTALSRLLGGTMIADVAILGTDMFFREGAAFGILFYARQSGMLGMSIAQERSARLKAGGVTETKVKLGKHAVSLLASPDGNVRSYYVADGDYHFVTTSRTLAARFLETASGAGSLGKSKGFRHARSLMPLSRNDTLFLYLSDAFFRNLTSPRYRVEMIRRLQAASDIDLVQLAVLASATEGRPGETIAQLIDGELLPTTFGPRPDGSRTVLQNGAVYDQLRGYRGSFLPIPDTPVTNVTPAERAAYERFADFYKTKWNGQMDPTIVGIKRSALSGNREKVVADVQLSPFAAEHFNFLSKWAGSPSAMQLVPIEGNMVAGELVLNDQHLFAGLVDFGPPMDLLSGQLFPFGRLRDFLVGYVGTTGQPGLLGLLDLQITTATDAQGYATNPLGLWRRQFGQFTVYSLHPEVLSAVAPQLKFQQAKRPAQLRLQIDDLSNARMTPFLNNWGYTRTRETSLGNIRLMHALDQQLHVPPEDCRQAAEFLLGAKLICPLGGKYVLKQDADGHGEWTSTALTPGGRSSLLGAQAPEGYQAPPLSWFRGVNLDATMTEKVLSAHAGLVMQLPPKKK